MPLPEENTASYFPVYCYIPRFRNYLANSHIPNPVTFGEIMSLICPRHLLYAGATSNSGHPGGLEVMQETWDEVSGFYSKAGGADNLDYHIYPGNHDFPPRAREFAYNWLDSKLRQRRGNK